MPARFPMAVVVTGSPLTVTIEGASAVVAAEDFVGGLTAGDRVQAAFLGDRLTVLARAGAGVLTVMSGPGDLSDVPYVSNGRFHQSSNSNAAAGANYPIPYAGMLEVSSASGFIYQRYTAYAPYSAVYFRAYYTAGGGVPGRNSWPNKRGHHGPRR